MKVEKITRIMFLFALNLQWRFRLVTATFKRFPANPWVSHPWLSLDVQFDLLVCCDSMNKVARRGEVFRCLDRSLTDFDVSDGSLVVIQKRAWERGSIELSETSLQLRRLRIVLGEVEFACESDAPNWRGQSLSDPHGEVQIIGKALWKYRSADYGVRIFHSCEPPA